MGRICLMQHDLNLLDVVVPETIVQLISDHTSVEYLFSIKYAPLLGADF
jgi:hypothetical protein